MDADLTDDELRAELVKFGQNVGPITGTTRKVWLKRLTSLRTSAKKNASKPSNQRKLVGLSSDDSQHSDEEAGLSQKSQPTSARRRTNKLSHSKSSPFPESSRSIKTADVVVKPVQVPKKISPRKTRSAPSPLQKQNSTSKKSKLSTTRLAEYSESDGDSTAEEPMEVGDNDSNHSYKYEPVISSSRRQVQTSVPSYLHSTVTGRRSISDLRRNVGHMEVAYGSESLYNDDGFMSSPPRSMLSMGINTTPSLEQSMGNSYQDSMGQSYQSDGPDTPHKSDKANHITRDKDVDHYATHGFETKEDIKSYRYPQYISLGLVFSVLAIFIGIACIYLVNVAVHSRENAVVNQKGLQALPANMTSTDRCLYSLIDYLSTIAGDAVCRSSSSVGRVAVDVAKARTQESCTAETWAQSLELLIVKRDWGVQLLTADETIAEKSSQVSFLISNRPNMPFGCRLRRSFHKLLLLTGYILIGLSFLGMVVYVVRRFRQRKEDAQRQFYDLVEEIMDTLQQHASACKQSRELKPYLAIPHVRDMLIPPGERQKKKKLWDAAVTFLDSNESRIRTEVQVIMGEEFLVWRWLPTVSDCVPATLASGRVWQGQAFVDTKSSKPHYSPTECLKVRNMFDACVEFGDEWPLTIQDAILEKCSSTCPRAIHHIAVDKNSKEGCVYIKCESREAAGEVYKALHGWWFDGKLVTVKYLRAERYLERFPESTAFTKALSPSNNKMLSMAAQS